MFWAAFGWRVKSDLVVMKGDPDSARGVTARKYQSVLKEHLPIVMDADSIFTHNNATIYKARTVQQWCQGVAISDDIDRPSLTPLG